MIANLREVALEAELCANSTSILTGYVSPGMPPPRDRILSYSRLFCSCFSPPSLPCPVQTHLLFMLLSSSSLPFRPHTSPAHTWDKRTPPRLIPVMSHRLLENSVETQHLPIPLPSSPASFLISRPGHQELELCPSISSAWLDWDM